MSQLAALFEGYLNNDPQATEGFFGWVRPLLVGYFCKETVSRLEAEDIAQDCCLKIHTSRAKFQAGMPVLPWIFGIARHTRLDAYRRQVKRIRREASLAEGYDFPDQVSLRATARVELGGLLDLLDQLPESQREALRLHYQRGLSQEEVSRLAGCSTAAVKQRVYRARTSLRQLFQGGSVLRGGKAGRRTNSEVDPPSSNRCWNRPSATTPATYRPAPGKAKRSGQSGPAKTVLPLASPNPSGPKKSFCH
ncbi:MAG: RNA polymerase sigma factor [Bryobacter sp.]|nr:RNA polymerase sigma factor [Bryobacter sp.]